MKGTRKRGHVGRIHISGDISESTTVNVQREAATANLITRAWNAVKSHPNKGKPTRTKI